jgi:hypothetical protein
MARKKKNAADFRLELTNFLTSLNNGDEQRVRDALRQYNALIKLRGRGKKPLMPEQIRLLNNSVLHDNYLLGKKLVQIEEKLRAVEKREAPSTAVRAAVSRLPNNSAASNSRAADAVAIESIQAISSRAPDADANVTPTTAPTASATTTSNVDIAFSAVDESI